VKYTIFSLGNPERAQRVEAIRGAMEGHDEVFIECVNGKDPEQLNANIDRYGFTHIDQEWRPGEGGLWYTNINAWQWAVDNNETLLTFEDDAIPLQYFNLGLDEIQSRLGAFDFATLYTPYRTAYQRGMFRLQRARQEHGNVCIAYSPQGAKKILDLLRQDGIKWPVDIWVFKQHIAKRLNGLSPKETSVVIVDHDFDVPTNIHEDERIPTR